MKPSDAQKKWEEYLSLELDHASRELSRIGYTLNDKQPHIKGERFLMMSGRDIGENGMKLVLYVTHTDTKIPAIAKIASDAPGREEIRRERNARKTLEKITFSYQTFRTPKEIFFEELRSHTIFITEFIEQTLSFIERPTPEQYRYALRALKTQESAHATTHGHKRAVRDIFGMYSKDDYMTSAKTFAQNILACELADTLQKEVGNALYTLSNNTDIIEQYTDFLTHTDFVPHNLRIRNNDIYLIDFASIHFGNKYESWARFINFMMLYNPELEKALVAYVRDNRSKEEGQALYLMRIYKLLFLLSFYCGKIEHTTNDLRTLTKERIIFWGQALHAVQNDTPLPEATVIQYMTTRDSLRSKDELERQQKLH